MYIKNYKQKIKNGLLMYIKNYKQKAKNSLLLSRILKKNNCIYINFNKFIKNMSIKKINIAILF